MSQAAVDCLEAPNPSPLAPGMALSPGMPIPELGNRLCMSGIGQQMRLGADSGPELVFYHSLTSIGIGHDARSKGRQSVCHCTASQRAALQLVQFCHGQSLV